MAISRSSPNSEQPTRINTMFFIIRLSAMRKIKSSMSRLSAGIIACPFSAAQASCHRRSDEKTGCQPRRRWNQQIGCQPRVSAVQAPDEIPNPPLDVHRITTVAISHPLLISLPLPPLLRLRRRSHHFHMYKLLWHSKSRRRFAGGWAGGGSGGSSSSSSFVERI